jgi:hypothetical protein
MKINNLKFNHSVNNKVNAEVKIRLNECKMDIKTFR